MEASYDFILDSEISQRFRNERSGRRGERFQPEFRDPDDDFGDTPELVERDPWQLP